MLPRIARIACMVLAMAMVSPAGAQKKLDEPATAEAVSRAKELLVAMGSMKQFDIVIVTMSRGLAEAFKRQAPDKGKEIDEVMALMVSKFNARKEEVLTMVAPLYAEKFSVDEMTEIGNFYKTAIGQKLIAAQPEIIQRSMQMGMAWGQAIGREVEAEARRELKKRGVDL